MADFMRRTLWPVSVVLVTFAASALGIGRVAAQQTAPGAAACTALGAATFTAVATLTTTYDAGSAAQPAHCVVRGSAAPRTGVDGKAYETRFELRLPTDWSGRFLYQGGGGNDGIVAPAVGRNTGSFPDTGLQRGFAVVTTDAGHQGGTPEFGLDPVARVDHAYAAHERTATIAFATVSRYYGRAPDRKYFVGCSGGGRQGMMFAQRYPTYFDGIAICAPAMSVSSGATIAAAWDTHPIFSALESIDYYQRLTRNNGGPEATAVWARLFLVPGMNHCAGGPATDSFDGLAAIVNWVEKGAAPSRIDASARPGASSFAGRTRPLCAFPAYARYTGTGSLDDGTNFTCAAR